MKPERLGSDFEWLWRAFAVSSVGSALSFGAVPMIAVLVLGASPLQVSLLVVIAGLCSAAIAVPLGVAIDRRQKRVFLIGAELAAGAAAVSVPAAAVAGVLSYPQLCGVEVVSTTASVASLAASSALLKQLIAAEHRTRAAARLDSATWLIFGGGPAAGGALVGALGATVTLLLDAISFLVSALMLSMIRFREGITAPAALGTHSRSDLCLGWLIIIRNKQLRALFVNALVFGGSVVLVSPLLAVLMLRDLHLTPLDYGLVLGTPCFAGAAGAWAAPRIEERIGQQRSLLVFGALRCPWLAAIPLAPHGIEGVVVLVAAEAGLMFTAGVFNPCFVSFRMDQTPTELMARVSSAWSVGSKLAQPTFVVIGGLIATATSVRFAIAVGAAVCLLSVVLLPWRAAQPAEPAELDQRPLEEAEAPAAAAA